MHTKEMDYIFDTPWTPFDEFKNELFFTMRQMGAKTMPTETEVLRLWHEIPDSVRDFYHVDHEPLPDCSVNFDICTKYKECQHWEDCAALYLNGLSAGLVFEI